MNEIKLRFGLRWIRAVALLAFCASAGSLQAQTPTVMPVVPLSAGIHVIKAEVAQSDADRAQGLMFRTSLGDSQGMLFLFETDATQCMWMKNTLIGLSVAFMGPDGRVINIENMDPQTETTHCATKPARYALEMNLGWFTKHGVKQGALISGLPKPNR